MDKLDYNCILCPAFKHKTVAYFGVFKYISEKNIELIIKNSEGTISKSFTEGRLDYIIFSDDCYFRYVRRMFKKKEEILYINECIKWRHISEPVKIISENDMIKLCNINISKFDNIFPKYFGKHIFKPVSNYVVLDLLTTGLDYNVDNIVKISLVKVINDCIVDKTSMDIMYTEANYHDHIPYSRQSLEMAVVEFVEFIEDLPILSCNTLFHTNFLFYSYNKIASGRIKNDYIDLLQLVSDLYPSIKKINTKSVSKKLAINLERHQLKALDWCFNVHYAYQKLKNRLRFRDTSSFTMNYFKNKHFVFDGIFESLSREKFRKAITYLGGKVSDKLTVSVDYLVLSNVCYFQYINGNKTKKQLTAENIIRQDRKLTIVSESTMKNMLYYSLLQNHAYSKIVSPDALLELLYY